MAARAADRRITNPLRRKRRRAHRKHVSESDRSTVSRCTSAASRTFGGISTATGNACALSPPLGIGKASPAHDPASVVRHGDQAGRKDENRHRGRVTSRIVFFPQPKSGLGSTGP